ncbi:hypothetical protein [Pelotomaculum propionicicum]|nr:hypothetical protein [Pelotomaculum propionicicum]
MSLYHGCAHDDSGVAGVLELASGKESGRGGVFAKRRAWLAF